MLVIYYCTSIKLLFTFLIIFIPHSRRFPRLVKAKILESFNLYLHYQFRHAYYEKYCLPGNIGSNAVQKNALLLTIASTIVQPKSVALTKNLHQKNLRFCKLVCIIYKLDLERASTFYDIFDEYCLLDLITVTMGNTNIGFTIIGCY